MKGRLAEKEKEWWVQEEGKEGGREEGNRGGKERDRKQRGGHLQPFISQMDVAAKCEPDQNQNTLPKSLSPIRAAGVTKSFSHLKWTENGMKAMV